MSRPKLGRGVSRTKQCFKDECDVNNIVKRYKKTGMLPDNIKESGLYGDYSTPFDYQDSLNTIIRAKDQFMGLPVEIRKRFEHDPFKFLEYVNNKDNFEEMYKIGLAIKPKEVVKPEELPKEDKK